MKITAVQAIPTLYKAMVIMLSAGLAGVLALGFGLRIPEWPVIAAIVMGTGAMIALMTIMIVTAGKTTKA